MNARRNPQSTPSVGVVIPTHNRPELLRRALASVLAQDYAGAIAVTVVFDRSEPDLGLVQLPALSPATLASPDPPPVRSVAVTTNTRTPGLAGARNTGILACDTDLIAFCDDDDEWLPGKLARQVARLQAEPARHFVTTAMQVQHADAAPVARLAGISTVTFADLARSRMSMLHSSSFLFTRRSMLDDDPFGLVDETMPRSMGEDWDLLLRAAKRGPIAHVDEPLIRVLWGQSSYFSDVWTDKIAANHWLVDRHPEIKQDRRTWALMLGKLAFGHAALGQRRAALSYAGRAARSNWREPRIGCALLVVVGVPSGWIVRALNRRGRSI